MSYPSINQNSKFDFNIKHSLRPRGPALGFLFSNFVPKGEEGAAIRKRQKDDRKSVNWPWTIINHFVLSGPAHSEDQLKDTLHWGPLFLKFPLSRLLSLDSGGYFEAVLLNTHHEIKHHEYRHNYLSC